MCKTVCLPDNVTVERERERDGKYRAMAFGKGYLLESNQECCNFTVCIQS